MKKVNDASLSVRLHPKWERLPCILVDFVPSLLIFNQSGVELTIWLGSNEDPEMVLNNHEVSYHAKIDIFRLGAIYDQLIFHSTQSVRLTDHNRPQWIDQSMTDEPVDVPLVGNIEIDLVTGTGSAQVVSLVLKSVNSHGVRRLFIQSRHQFQNQTSIPLSASICHSVRPVTSQGGHTPRDFISLPLISPSEHNLQCTIWSHLNACTVGFNLGEKRKPFCLAASPKKESDWSMISVHHYGTSITRFVVTEMNERQPPRYFITNHSLVNLVIFETEEAQKFSILPGESIHFESETENEHFPSTDRCQTVKIFVQTGYETGHFFLHPGEQGARLQNTKLLVKIDEFGKRRKITISSKGSAGGIFLCAKFFVSANY